MKQIVEEFGKDVFLLRYEDLCVQPEKAAAALEKWLPKMGKLNINAIAKTFQKNHTEKEEIHSHDSSLTIPEYCNRIAVPSWPLNRSIQVSEADNISGRYLGGESSINDLMSFFGYTPTFNETT